MPAARVSQAVADGAGTLEGLDVDLGQAREGVGSQRRAAREVTQDEHSGLLLDRGHLRVPRGLRQDVILMQMTVQVGFERLKFGRRVAAIELRGEAGDQVGDLKRRIVMRLAEPDRPREI